MILRYVIHIIIANNPMAFFHYRPTKPLNHYCSEDAFRGILESKTLWFSDLTMTNDPRELSLGRTEVMDAFKHVRRNSALGENGTFLSVIAARSEESFSNLQFLSCCFSNRMDSRSLWREYADQGKGFVISFRPTAILRIPARVQKVKYSDSNTQEAMRSIIRNIARPIAENHFGTGKDNTEFVTNSMIDVITAITSLKHNSWEEEDEIRMVHTAVRDAKGRAREEQLMRETFKNNLQLRDRLGFQTRNNGEIEIDYVPFPFGKYNNGKIDHSRAISSVTMGPNCSLSKDELVEILNANGFKDYDILKSECAFTF